MSKAIHAQEALDATSPTVAQVSAKKFFLANQTSPLISAISQQSCGALETKSGCFYTIKPGASKILLNINPATSAFFKPMLVSDFLLDSQTFTGTSTNDRYNMLAGKRVVITHGRGKDQ
jgi:eukaryotic translation initiation factor 2C